MAKYSQNCNLRSMFDVLAFKDGDAVGVTDLGGQIAFRGCGKAASRAQIGSEGGARSGLIAVPSRRARRMAISLSML